MHDAAGIIFELLRIYPKCSKCPEPATRQAQPKSIIIGDLPRFCDLCETPADWKVSDLFEARVVRAANGYLATHAMKT